ncbi:MAG: hypothetical protein WC292_01910 [Clostridia bacterium]
MKFLNLVYEGVGGKKGAIDFSNKVHGLTVVQDAESQFLKLLLKLSLYGISEDSDKLDYPAKVEFKFACEDKEFNLVRTFTQTDGKAVEFATLTDLAGREVFAEGKDMVKEYVAKHLPWQVFDALFVLEKEEIGTAFTAEPAERDAFINQSFAALPQPEMISARLTELKTAEKELLTHIDALPQVTKKAITESRKFAAARQAETETVKKDIEEINKDIARAVAYQADTSEYYDATAYSEKLKVLQTEVEQMQSAVQTSHTVSAISAVFTEHREVKTSVAQERAILAIREEELKAVNTKIAEGEASIQAFENQFIYQNEKKEALEKSIRDLIAESASSPERFKINSRVDGYYRELEEERELLSQHLAAGEEQLANLAAEIEEIAAKRDEFKNTAEYKSNVENAAIFERDLKYLDREIKEADAALDALDKKRAALYAKNVELSSKALELRQEQKTLLKSILGDKDSIQGAVNADVYYKQTIYSKHLIVSANEVELDAVEKKIASVKKASEKYNDSLAESQAHKEEVEEHLAKLNERLALLNAKRSEYEGYNKMKDIAQDLEYGSRCPVCDGFVTLKKELQQKDTTALDAQIEAIKNEAAKSEAALLKVTSNMGQYDSAARVSSQYLEALNNTANAKRAIIKEILVEYDAKDIAELFDMVKKAVENSNNLTLTIDRYRANETELRGLTEAEAIIVAELQKLTDTLIPAQTDKLKALLDEAAKRGADYEGVQHILNDEKAEDLLIKLQVIEDEYEKLETLLAERESEYKELASALADLRRDILLLETRAIPIKVDGEDLTHQNVIIKAVLADLQAFIKEIDICEEEKEIAKTRLAALRRVLAKSRDKKALLDTQTAALRAKLDSAEKVAGAMFAVYEEQFKELDITSERDIEALTLSSETIDEYQKRIASYEEESVRLKDRLERLTASLAAGQPYFEALDGLNETLAALESEEKAAIIRWGEAQKDCDEKIEVYNERIKANIRLSYLQSRIKGIEELFGVVKDDKLDAAAFVTAVTERATSRIKKWSQDKYYLTIKDDKVVLVNDRNGRTINREKYTKEERMLALTGIASVYNEALLKLYGTEFTPIITVGADESDKNSLAALAEITKDRELLAVPQDENVFFRNISKLG